MKIMKKAMAVILSMVMMLAMCATAFAENNQTTFTITAPDTDHQYEIYQIFTGDWDAGDNLLLNEKWGVNGTEETGRAVDEATLNALKDLNGSDDATKLETIKKYVTLSNPVATITKKGTYTAVPGYYLIKDKDGTVTGNDAYTTYIVMVASDTTIAPKSDVPSFVKKIKDANDTDGTVTGWQDSADYDIGDEVPFKLEGTVTSKYADYKHYYFAFHDQQETGLTFNPSSVKVYVDDTEITDTTKYEVKTTGLGDGCTFEVVFNDLKDISAVTAGSTIRVEYTSTLNSNAVLGNQGNVNKAKLEFSNNPNSDQEGKPDHPGETPWDNVIVFTYKVVVDKYAESVNGEKLAGAAFKLEKVLKNGEKKLITENSVSDDGTSFTFKGLDDGQYILTETTTPTGYNTIDPITFTVTANHTIEWDGNNRDQVLTGLTGTEATGEITFTADENKSELATKVVNKKGITLPSTGGIGTTIFYVIGGVLMAAAAVLLITKKRMELHN